MLIQLADYFGERLAPRPRHDTEDVADTTAIEHRIGRTARRGRVFGGGDRLDRGRPAAPWRRQFEDRFGKAVPGHRAAAGEVISAPSPIARCKTLHDRGD